MKILKFKGKGKNCDVSILYNMKGLIELRNNLNRFLKTPVTKAALEP